MSPLLNVKGSTLTRLVCQADLPFSEFVDQLVLARAMGVRSPFKPGPGFLQIPDAWVELIERLVAYRDSGKQWQLTLLSGAAALLAGYQNEIDHLKLRQGRLLKNAPLIAAKIALILHLCAVDPGNEISEELMRDAITLAKGFVLESAETARVCATEPAEKTLRDEAACMLHKLQSIEPAKPRTLFRLYDDHTKALHQPALDYLQRTGQVRSRPDGLLEIVRRETGDSR